MPRDIPIGNSRLLICFDQNYCIRDLYFPHVGQENHVMGNCCRFGVWAEDIFSWVGPEWKKELLYTEDTLVTRVSLYHEKMRVLLTCRDAVDFHEDIYLREITVENLAAHEREIRLFMNHTLSISGNNVGDTAAYDPKSTGIIHYKGKRYFLANGMSDSDPGPARFAVGQAGVNQKEGTYRDAEDGLLSGNTIAQGSVDSVLGLHLRVAARSAAKAYYWLAAGRSWAEVHRLDSLVRHKGVAALIRRTADYWHLWCRKETPALENFSAKISSLYKRSLLILATQIDAAGGITAANDSDVVQFNRDTYSYIWPRDGALVANALDVAGYPIMARNFYNFAARTLSEEGYFLHKYNPDGSLASSWHPWAVGGRVQLPIQEDETALVLWALWNHFVLYRDIEFIKPLYRPLIKRAAEFMWGYRDRVTGLPDFSYDLWEERRGSLSFTTGAVFGGLTAASLFCTVFGEEEKAQRYRVAASEIRDAASRYLWQETLNRFCRMVYRDDDGALAVDPACDASLWGLFAFGMYSIEDERIRATMAALRDKLWLRTEVGGMARNEDDPYYRLRPDLPGNPWFVCTLWLADYYAGLAQSEEALGPAQDILQWAADHALPSGVLAEQLNSITGEPLSVSPLTWSHATFVASTRKVLRILARLRACPQCGLTSIYHAPGEDWLETLYSQACNEIHGICSIK